MLLCYRSPVELSTYGEMTTRLRGAPVGDLGGTCLESTVFIGLHGITSGNARVHYLADRRFLHASDNEPRLERHRASCFLVVMTGKGGSCDADIHEQVVRLFARLPTRHSSAIPVHFLRV